MNLEALKYEKSIDALSYFKSLVESLLKKQNNSYDIYLYSSTYTSMYGPYLLNLNLNLPKEHIEMYNSKVLKGECTYKDELVGLVIFIKFINKLKITITIIIKKLYFYIINCILLAIEFIL